MNKKKRLKNEMIINGVKYLQIRVDKEDETYWMNVPIVNENIPASGLHLMDKDRHRTHFDFYDGENKTSKKEYLREPPKIKAFKIDMKQGTTFIGPPQNQILVLRDSDKPEEWISFDYYKKNKDKYYLKIGTEDDPKLLGVKKINS